MSAKGDARKPFDTYWNTKRWHDLNSSTIPIAWSISAIHGGWGVAVVVVISDSRSRLAAANHKGLSDTHTHHSLSRALDKAMQQRAGHEEEQAKRHGPQPVGKERLLKCYAHST